MITARPFVSIVTPFYNTGEYLAECIESVLNQSYGNFEYVLVDNQSTDDSGNIAGSYAKRDRRVRLVRTPTFLTQLQNASFAFQQIDPHSQYCKLVYADDWLYPQCVDLMVTLADAQPGIGIISSYYIWGTRVAGLGLDTRRSTFTGREVCRRFFLDGVFPFGSPSTVMYRASVVRAHTPFFVDGNLHEDTEVIVRLLQDTDFGFVHQILSSLRLQEGSITYSNRAMHADALDRLIMLTKYGRRFLDDAEYEHLFDRASRWYYRGLAKQWVADRFGRPTPGFWDYQAKGLATINQRVDMSTVARHVLGAAVESAFRVTDLMRALKQILRSNKPASK